MVTVATLRVTLILCFPMLKCRHVGSIWYSAFSQLKKITEAIMYLNDLIPTIFVCGIIIMLIK